MGTATTLLSFLVSSRRPVWTFAYYLTDVTQAGQKNSGLMLESHSCFVLFHAWPRNISYLNYGKGILT
jgi:hypothetical protein